MTDMHFHWLLFNNSNERCRAETTSSRDKCQAARNWDSVTHWNNFSCVSRRKKCSNCAKNGPWSERWLRLVLATQKVSYLDKNRSPFPRNPQFYPVWAKSVNMLRNLHAMTLFSILQNSLRIHISFLKLLLELIKCCRVLSHQVHQPKMTV